MKLSRKLCVMRRCSALPPVKESWTLFARSKRKPTKSPPRFPQTVSPPTSRKYLPQIPLFDITDLAQRELISRKMETLGKQASLCRSRSVCDPVHATAGLLKHRHVIDSMLDASKAFTA